MIMVQQVRALYKDGVLQPLDRLQLEENTEVQLTVRPWSPVADHEVPDDPLADIRVDTGIPDLAENFDDYRFGRKKP